MIPGQLSFRYETKALYQVYQYTIFLAVRVSFWNEMVNKWQQFTERKKMADVHFTTIPCKPNTADRHI